MKRLKKIFLVIAVVAVLVIAPLLYSKWNLQRSYDGLAAKATSLGIRLALPEPVRDAEAEALRQKLKEFDERELDFETLGISIDTDDPHQIDVIFDDIKEIIPTAFALSAVDSFGVEESLISLQELEALMYLTVVTKKSIIERDLRGTIDSLKAIRKIAHLIDRSETVNAGAVDIFCRTYGGLLLQAAAAFNTSVQISALIAEADEWELDDFGITASYLAANELSYLDDRVENGASESVLDKLTRPISTSKHAILTSKIRTLRQAIAIVPQWSDSRFVLESTRRPEFDLGLAYFARIIKVQELNLRSGLAATRAGLQARLLTIKKKPLPTMEDLSKLGIQTADPVSGKTYQWRDFNGKPRLFGVTHQHEGPPVEDWLLLTDQERRAKKTP